MKSLFIIKSMKIINLTLNNPFSWSYYLFLLWLILLFFCVQKRVVTPPKRWLFNWHGLYFLTLTTTFNWIALFFSFRSLTITSVHEPVGYGGFPFTCFYYPIHPMGHNFPPFEQWLFFYVNLLLSALVSGLLLFFIYKKRISGKLTNWLNDVEVWLFFLIINFVGLAYVFFRFE